MSKYLNIDSGKVRYLLFLNRFNVAITLSDKLIYSLELQNTFKSASPIESGLT